MAAAVAKPAGKGLSGMFSGKVGGVPKSVLFLVLAVALYFVIGKFLKNKSTNSTSAGTNSVPTAPDNVGYPQPQDSTGGGAAGQPMMDMTGLTDALNNQLQQMQVPAGDTYNYYYTGDPASVGQGGGNVSPAASLQNVATPSSSFPTEPLQQKALSLINQGIPIDFTSGGQTLTLPTLSATNLQSAAVRSTLGKAVGPSTAVSVKATPNKTGVSANAKQGVFAIH